MIHNERKSLLKPYMIPYVGLFHNKTCFRVSEADWCLGKGCRFCWVAMQLDKEWPALFFLLVVFKFVLQQLRGHGQMQTVEFDMQASKQIFIHHDWAANQLVPLYLFCARSTHALPDSHAGQAKNCLPLLKLVPCTLITQHISNGSESEGFWHALFLFTRFEASEPFSCLVACHSSSLKDMF